MTRAFWGDLSSLVRRSFFKIQDCIYSQASWNLDGPALSSFGLYFLMGPSRLRIPKMVIHLRSMDKDWNHSWSWEVEKWRRPYWKIRIIQNNCRLLWKVWLKTLNLALVGGNPHYFSFCYLILFLLCVLFLRVFQVKCLSFKFGGAFSYVVPDLRHPAGIVFLVTLRTMCHFSLGVG